MAVPSSSPLVRSKVPRPSCASIPPTDPGCRRPDSGRAPSRPGSTCRPRPRSPRARPARPRSRSYRPLPLRVAIPLHQCAADMAVGGIGSGKARTISLIDPHLTERSHTRARTDDELAKMLHPRGTHLLASAVCATCAARRAVLAGLLSCTGPTTPVAATRGALQRLQRSRSTSAVRVRGLGRRAPDAGSGAARIDPDGDDDPSDTGTELSSDARPLHSDRSTAAVPLAHLRPDALSRRAVRGARPPSRSAPTGATITRYVAQDADSETRAPASSPSSSTGTGPASRPRAAGAARRSLARACHHDGRGARGSSWRTRIPLTVGWACSTAAPKVTFSLRTAKAPSPRHGGPATVPCASRRPTAAPAPASSLARITTHFDVIRFRGQLLASTGAVPPEARAWTGPSPGALHAASADLSRFSYVTDFPFP